MRCVLASLLGAVACSWGAAAALAAATPLKVGAAIPSGAVMLAGTSGAPVAISSDPVGLSIEYPVLASDFGAGPCPPPELATTIEGLGVPTIRIGGDSQDETAPAGAPPFPGVTDLPTDFWSQLACLEGETHEPFVIGLNLASQMPAWAATMAAGARSAVPADLLSFEIGNEADIDGPAVPWWNATETAHSLIPFETYLDDAEAVAGQLGPGPDIEGPDFATPRWISDIPQLASALSLHTIDTHYYPLNACTGLAQATVAALLSRGASGLSSAVLSTLAVARRLQLPMVISESNSVACHGKLGVSDTPAAAVWSLRLVINAIRGGITAVRFHSSDSSYDPFVVSGSVVTTRPLYSGLQEAVQLLPVGGTLSTLRTPSALMGVVVTDPDGAKSYIVTDYAKQPRTVAVRASRSTTVLRVIASDPVVEQGSANPSHGIVSVVVAPDTVVAITLGS